MMAAAITKRPDDRRRPMTIFLNQVWSVWLQVHVRLELAFEWGFEASTVVVVEYLIS